MSKGAQKLVTVVWSGLAGEVRHVRNRRNLSLEVVCDQLGWQQSKLSRMERGQQCISTADLASLLVIYKVTGTERNRLL
ncbi:MAG TPA: helix-turn-helix transcriptional regulator, partial [Pseudonocardiaceae bacterium]